MPISQSRMQSLLIEAREFTRVHEALRKALEQILIGHAADPFPDAQAVCDVIRYTLDMSPRLFDRHLFAEEEHFRRNARRNEYNRKRMAAQRYARTARGTPQEELPTFAPHATPRRGADIASAQCAPCVPSGTQTAPSPVDVQTAQELQDAARADADEVAAPLRGVQGLVK